MALNPREPLTLIGSGAYRFQGISESSLAALLILISGTSNRFGDMESIALDVDCWQSCGLLVNELSQQPQIRLSGSRNGTNQGRDI